MNRLQYETSPYLLQHADNPVDWYPWGEEALARAKADDKPILLSIGYSACHWCHVMAHESFEDEDTARYMNAHFVNVKVDREERPDLDEIYMQATLIYTRGHGGWPMTVFLTPDGRPFHGGTYFPPLPRYGMPSFQQVMQAVVDAYQNQRERLEEAASEVARALALSNEPFNGELPTGAVDADLLTHAAKQLIARADRMYGGLHPGQPKFPSPMNLDFVLRYAQHTDDLSYLDTVIFTLIKMAQGGIYDQLGGGFHRYSVDERWLVPHFEKMLYDNAQLARVYLHAYQITRDAFFRRICEEILAYVQREMVDTSGGFYSTQDADSEGEEGKFFVWSPAQARAVLQSELPQTHLAAVLFWYDISDKGNFEGRSIPNLPHGIDSVAEKFGLAQAELETSIQKARQLLFEAREKRIKPGRDEKMLTAWNGMMMAAFAEAARVLDNNSYRQIAENNAAFLINTLTMPDGRLYRTHKRYPEGKSGGESKLNGYLEDYAHVIDGLLELYQTTFAPRWFEEAQRLADDVLAHFVDAENGGFFDTSDTHEKLIARPKGLQDNATPSGSSLMAFNLMRLYGYTGVAQYEAAATKVLDLVVAGMREYPSAFGMALAAADLLVHRPVEVAIIGDRQDALTPQILNMVQKPFRPRVIVALSAHDEGEVATPMLLAHRTRKNNQPTVYICQGFVCQQPVNTVAEVEALL